MSDKTAFQNECNGNIEKQGNDQRLGEQTKDWIIKTAKYKYSYNFAWQGRPIIQYPQDIMAMQEIIWQIKPDLIIETGIAHGGSLIFSASMLSLLDMCDGIEGEIKINPKVSKRKVLGIDIDIREHNRVAIEAHPMSSRIQMIEGSSIAPEVIEQVYDVAKDYKHILVLLDSNHTYAHVLAELEAYASLTSVGSYCVVFDTIINDMPKEMFPDRPWGPSNNPKTAVCQYLKKHTEFEVDQSIGNKLLVTVAPGGYLRRIS